MILVDYYIPYAMISVDYYVPHAMISVAAAQVQLAPSLSMCGWQIAFLMLVLLVVVGYYMYLETSGTALGQMARLVSPLYNTPSTPQSCTFQFFYHMYGSTIGTLSMKVIQSGSTSAVQKWSKSKQQQNKWLPGSFLVGSQKAFQVSSCPFIYDM